MLRYHDVCSKDKLDLGCADVIEHSIVMEDERPVHQRQFRIPFAHEEVLYEYVNKLLKLGAIKVSRSLYNSAVFCMAKKQLPNAAPGDPVPLSTRNLSRQWSPFFLLPRFFQSFTVKVCKVCWRTK
jgi:hypothetical protein